MGVNVVTDYNGAIQRTGISSTYAYHITMNQSQLSFGLTASIFETQIRSRYLNFKDNSEEPLLSLANSPYWIPDFAAGINYMDRYFHIGFSASQLLESAFVLGNSGINKGLDIHYKRNYNLISSYKHEFKSGSEWEYEPSVLIKMYDPFYFKPVYSGPQVQADLMLRLICNRSYWFGAAYRTSKEYVALLGIRYENLYVSYSFDYGNNGISRNSYGSHELSVSLKFGDGARRVPWMERY